LETIAEGVQIGVTELYVSQVLKRNLNLYLKQLRSHAEAIEPVIVFKIDYC